MFRRKFLWTMFVLPWTSSVALGVTKADLFVAKSLEREVQFWEKVFSKYEANECVFHDSWRLDVVYGIKRLTANSRRGEEDQIEKQRTKIKGALLKFALGRKPANRTEQMVYNAIPADLKNRKFFQEALNNVRCQKGVATSFRQSLVRSQKFLPMIRKVFANHGLPQDLVYLPHLESGFNNRAHSKVGARGLWQLMPGKARELRLRVNQRFDDRINPWVATKAAAKMLSHNFQKTGSWPLALTGYNYGINGISRGIKRLGSADFLTFRLKHQSPIFGFAARNFYPSFIAVKNIAKRHEVKLSNVKLERVDIAAK